MPLVLCLAEDIPEGGARGFDLQGRRVFAVKQYDRIFVYLNRCPHLGVPLEWITDAFLDPQGAYIRCSTHGALFLKDSGECIQGPYLKNSLWSLEHREEGGRILLDADELPPPRPAVP